MKQRTPGLLTSLLLMSVATASAAEPLKFQRQEIDKRVGEVCYAVTVADVDGDHKRDVVALSEDAAVWYHNPDWTRHDLCRGKTQRDNVCIQPLLAEGDTQIDFIVGSGWRPSDTRNPSTLHFLTRNALHTWKLIPIPYTEPTLHRIRIGDVKGSKTEQLVTAPLQGRGTKGPDWGQGSGARIQVFDIPADPSGPWTAETADDSLHTVHNFQLVNMDDDLRREILVAAWEGVFILDRDEHGRWTKERIGTGAQDTHPFKGASEIKLGRMRDGREYLATIEPWHGNQVVIYTPLPARTGTSLRGLGLWQRTVIAEPVSWGHAVWCADLDADGDDELLIGQRDRNPPSSEPPRGPGILVFDPIDNAQPLGFQRIAVDDAGVACEDALAADLDGDRLPEIIAGGRATHNVVIYWNRTRLTKGKNRP